MSSAVKDVISESPATRARYEDPENFFAFKWPEVPRHQFNDERDAAFASDAPTGEILLDISSTLETPYPATTPLLLARYLVVNSADKLQFTRRASAEIFYVMRGAGVATGCGESIEWSTGEVFMFPGGQPITIDAHQDTVLFSVCNEPLVTFESLHPSANGHDRVLPTHWTRADIDKHFEPILSRPNSEQTAGRALQLTAAAMAPARHPVPSINVAFNTLEPGDDQRPHRHNGVAITLSIQGDGVHSMIEDERVDWSEFAAQITPATELHSHHNRGTQRMESIVFQDEGLHFYTRTPGFSWT
ncbi:MAG: cupin domain-containing protein [Gammaproteobacteria bacterium]|nr:cupin domain-containing protein [Gammaproteobacteria bacterium]